MRPWVKNRGEVCITNGRRIKVDSLEKGLKSGNHSLVWKKTKDLNHRSRGPLVIDVIEMVLISFYKKGGKFSFILLIPPSWAQESVQRTHKHRKGASRQSR